MLKEIEIEKKNFFKIFVASKLLKTELLWMLAFLNAYFMATFRGIPSRAILVRLYYKEVHRNATFLYLNVIFMQ